MNGAQRLNPSIDSGQLLERLEQAQAKIVLSFMKDSGATISSVDHMIDKASLLPARDFSACAASIILQRAIATGKSSLSPLTLQFFSNR